jgi:hypothetical protein
MLQYSRGFNIERPAGNNAFSFEGRKNKTIYVPPLVEGDLADLAAGENTAFSEVRDGKEINANGLRNFVHWSRAAKEIFIFDNHNHAFFFWCWGLSIGWLRPGMALVHVDQHKDTRPPPVLTPFGSLKDIDLNRAFEYTNYTLNVGNFIPPALALGIFSASSNVDSREAFERDLPAGYVLDIDLDIFAPEMEYIPREIKICRLREWIAAARFITVATSPFFMEQQEAIRIVKELLDER